jgi:PAS domain S-box-containing protein
MSGKKLRKHRDHLEELVEERTSELKTSQKRLAQIIDFLPDPTRVVDNDGPVVTWNLAKEKLLGIKAEDMIGKGNFEYALPFYGERRPVLIDLIHQWDAGYEKEYFSFKKEGDILSKINRLEQKITLTRESVQTLDPAEVLTTTEPTEDVFKHVPPDVAQDAAKRIREAAEMGDISQLKTVAERLASHTPSFSPIKPENYSIRRRI